jgi:hypothetical protein
MSSIRAKLLRFETLRSGGKLMWLQFILLGCLMAVLYSLLSEAQAPASVTALTMGAAFVGAIIYGLITEA